MVFCLGKTKKNYFGGFYWVGKNCASPSANWLKSDNFLIFSYLVLNNLGPTTAT